MLDGERDMDTCTCVGMHMHACMGSLPQTDGRLHRRTTVYDASRPGTVCGSLQGMCTCMYVFGCWGRSDLRRCCPASPSTLSWVPPCERGRAGLR